MFTRQAQPTSTPSPRPAASNDNGARPVRAPQRGAAGAGGIVGIAAEIAGTVALLYVADGVFRISRCEGASA